MGNIVPYFKMQVGDGYSVDIFSNVVRNLKSSEKMEKKVPLPQSIFGGKELSL